MIDQRFQEAIEAVYATYPIRYGSAEGESYPYHRMIKIVDPERPVTYCDDQGEAGRALFQFDTFAGDNSTEVMNIAQALKEIVKDIRGTIGVTGDKYIIDNNITTGVRLISEGSSSLGVWGVIFETEIVWHKI